MHEGAILLSKLLELSKKHPVSLASAVAHNNMDMVRFSLASKAVGVKFLFKVRENARWNDAADRRIGWENFRPIYQEHCDSLIPETQEAIRSSVLSHGAPEVLLDFLLGFVGRRTLNGDCKAWLERQEKTTS